MNKITKQIFTFEEGLHNHIQRDNYNANEEWQQVGEDIFL